MSDNYKSCKAHVGIHSDDGRRNLMYILIDDKSAFDFIDLPEGGNVAVRRKALDNGKAHIIFQYWCPVFQKIDQAFRSDAYWFKQSIAKSQEPKAGVA